MGIGESDEENLERMRLTLIMLMGVFFYPQTHIFNRCLVENGNISKSLVTFPRYMSHRIQYSQRDD